MKQVNFCIGLPRSGSSLLMNIIQQNPQIYTTGTCPISYLFDSCFNISSQVSEFIAMDNDALTNSLNSFLKHGMNGWFTSLTNKPVIISKSRTWDTHIRSLFAIYEKPKFIVCLRDIRDIICSFEKLLAKNNRIIPTYKNKPLHFFPFNERIEIYCTDEMANLGRPLQLLPYIYEWMEKRPKSFFICRFEDFNNNPLQSLQSLYSWLECDYYEHDLNNIPKSEYVEHDTVYRALVDHKTRPKFEKLESSWPRMMTKGQSDSILYNCRWYYEKFYPELL